MSQNGSNCVRCALVTGAAGGIGRATAIVLSRAGWRLLLTDRDAGGLEAVAGRVKAEVSREAVVIKGDVTDARLGSELAEAVRSKGWVLGGLVNNAGAISGSPLEHTTDAEWHRLFEVNVTSQIACIKGW